MDFANAEEEGLIQSWPLWMESTATNEAGHDFSPYNH